MGTQQSIGKSVVQQFVGVAEYSLKPQLKGITVFLNFFSASGAVTAATIPQILGCTSETIARIPAPLCIRRVAHN